MTVQTRKATQTASPGWPDTRAARSARLSSAHAARSFMNMYVTCFMRLVVAVTWLRPVMSRAPHQYGTSTTEAFVSATHTFSNSSSTTAAA